MRPLVLALLLAAPLAAQDDGSPPGPSADKLSRFSRFHALSIESNGLTSEDGGHPTTPAKTDGKTEPTYEQKRAARQAGYDREFGDGSYQKVIDFSAKCLPAECDPSGIVNTIDGADRFVALQQDVLDKKVDAASSDYTQRHGTIKSDLNQTLDFFRPREGSRPEYVEEFVRVSDPIVKRIFSPEEMLALATRVAEETRTAPGYARLGRELHAQGKPDRAAQAYAFAITEDPRYADAYTGRALAEYELRRYPQAALDAKQALELKPSDPVASQTLALAKGRLDQGTFESLMKDPTKGKGMGALRPDAGLPDVGVVSDGGGSVTPATAGAAARAGQAPAPSPEAAKAAGLVAEARRAIKRGDHSEAVRLLERALALDPRSAPAHALSAIAFSKLKEYRPALLAAEKGLLLKRNDSALLTIKASAHNRLGDRAAALAASELAITLDAKSAAAHFNRAEALAGLGRRAEAIEELRVAAGLDPELTPFLDMALQLPADADLALMFTDAQLGAAPSLLDRLERVSPLAWGGAGALVVVVLLVLAAVAKARSEQSLAGPATASRRTTRGR